MMSIQQPLLQTLLYIGLAYLGLITTFALFSNYFIYLPPKNTPFVPSDHTHQIRAGDKTIQASYFPNKHSKYTILYSHGNAEDLGTLQGLLEYYQHQGLSVFAYDYEGYGHSEGTPNEANTYRDIKAAYHYMQEVLKIPAHRIIVYGRSLGSGPTLYLASRQPVAGVILESPFVSAFRAVTHFPILPFDKYPNIKRIGKINAPLLIIHGKKDTIIPFWHGKKLYKKALKPKMKLWLNKANHNDILIAAGDLYWQAMDEFIDSLE